MRALVLFAALVAAIGAQHSAAAGALEVSRRAQCAIDCYIKCVSAGTPKAVYCNCPLSLDAQPCDGVNEEIIKANTINTVPQVETTYRDVRTIAVKMEPYNGAFIYVFEFSTISGDADKWTFAGASSSPTIQFNVPDACRDYQFRAVVVLRSTDPTLQLVAFRARAIPVQLPKFVVPAEDIHLDPPRQSADDQSLHAYVSWHNPAGYDDADIYGYEQPVAYPISCQTPEDRLTQPRVELVEGGGRMHINFPVDVLSEKCRIFVEVRMLPRCVRVDSFDIQASIEITCDKFPGLPYCQKDQSPQCISVVDVWGKDGKVMVVWQPPEATPLHYILKYGMGEQRGARPFIARKILQGEEFKINGSQTHAELVARPGIEYGLQICGIYSNARNKPPFEVAPVVPFICAECPSDALDCIDCAKIDDSPSVPFIPVVECGDDNNCTNVNKESVSANEASLSLATPAADDPAKNPGRQSVAVTTLTPRRQQKHREPLPAQNRVGPSSSSGSIEDITITSAEGSGDGLAERVRGRFVQAGVPRQELVEVEADPTRLTRIDDQLEEVVVEEERVTLLPKHVSTALHANTPQSTTPKTDLSHAAEAARATSTRPRTTSATPATTTVTGRVSLVSVTTPAADKPKLDGVRLHQHTRPPPPTAAPCRLRSGLQCERACLDDVRCECAPDPAAPCIRGLRCHRVADLRAHLDNRTLTLRLHSRTLAQLVRRAHAAADYDKLYMEFGELRPRLAAAHPAAPTYGFVKEKGREHAMIDLNAETDADLFDKVPFELKLRSAPRLDAANAYGLSVCAVNSTLAPTILDNALIEQSAFNDNSVAYLTQGLLAPLNLVEEGAAGGRFDSHRGFLIFLGPAFLVMGVLIFGITVLCMGVIRQRSTAAAKLRRRGLLRSPSGMQFTAYRPTLGVSPTSFYSDNTSRYYMTRNVHF